MFYDVFVSLCKTNKFAQSKVMSDIGLNRAAIMKWKKGGMPNSSTLSKLANYFNVSIDYLLGNEKTPAAQSDEFIKEKEFEITFDDFSYAMYEEGKTLTREQKKALLEMARLFHRQLNKENKIDK